VKRLKELWVSFCDSISNLTDLAYRGLVKVLAWLLLVVVAGLVLTGVTLASWRTLSLFVGWDVPMFDGVAVLVTLWLVVWLPVYEGIRRWHGRDPPSLLTG
jgi:hypothetical protein